MRPDTITIQIFEKFTAENKAEIADQLAQVISEVETIETDKKTSDAGFNARIKECNGKIADLAKRYNKGGESALIGCDIRYDVPEVGQKSYVRMDTGEAVEVHEITWEEKQETIQFPLADQKAPDPTKDVVDAAIENLSGHDEVTRLCPYPGCILFAEHDGDHEFPDPPPDDRQPPEQTA